MCRYTTADQVEEARECMNELLQPGLGALSMNKVGLYKLNSS